MKTIGEISQVAESLVAALQSSEEVLQKAIIAKGSGGDEIPLEATTRINHAVFDEAGRKAPITGHLLAKADEHTQRLYLHFLTTLTILSESDENREARTLLLSRILAALKTTGFSIETCLVRANTSALRLDELLLTVTADLKEAFILDAILFGYICGQPEKRILSYVTEVISLFCPKLERVRELSLLAQTILKQEAGSFQFNPFGQHLMGYWAEVKVGARMEHRLENNRTFFMRLAPAASFPMGTSDDKTGTVKIPFWIAETQVTGGLWNAVRKFALAQGYSLGAGRSHGVDHPITDVSFRDSIVFCNALSEQLGLEPVYTYQSKVIKNAGDATSCGNAVEEERNGFRLPTSKEWELAARYKGKDASHNAVAKGGMYWTPGSYASGATADYNNEQATKAVAWYSGNAGGTAKPVGQKLANGLGLYDMSGNVWEWCFTVSGSYRVNRGGSWSLTAVYLQVGRVSSDTPGDVYDYLGLRLVRTQF